MNLLVENDNTWDNNIQKTTHVTTAGKIKSTSKVIHVHNK
jgi:hypothetical protein